MDGPPDEHVPDEPTVGSSDGDDPAVAAAADGPIDDLDHAALDALARALDAVDPVPTGLVERARFAVALEELEAEVATIQRTASPDLLAGVRGVEDQALTMTFTAESLSLTVAVSAVGRDRHRLDGWVTAREPVTVTLRLRGEARRRADVVDGRFVFDDVPSGIVQVVVARGTDGGPVVVTPAFEL